MDTSPAKASRRPRAVGSRQLLLLGIICNSPIVAAVELEPALSVGLIHTDNLTLTSVDPQSESVLQVVPSFRLTEASARIDADIALRVEGYYYHELDDSSVYTQFDSDVTATLVPDSLFLDLGGSRSQSIVDPQGTIPFGNLPINNNRVDRDELYLGPRFQVPFGSNVALTGGVRRTWTEYDAPDPSLGVTFEVTDYTYDTGNVGIDNYRREAGFAWALRYSYNKSDYGSGIVDFEYREERIELGYWVGQGARLYASGGRESPWDKPLEPDPEDSFWEVGIARQVENGRLRFDVAAGERSFGSSRRASVTYAFSGGSTSLSYAETPTTDSQNRYGPGLLIFGGFDDLLLRAGSAQRYISKRLQGDISLEGQRTELTLSLVDDSREERTLADGTPLADERYSGARFSVTRQLGARTELILSLSHTRSEYANQGERDFDVGSIAANYELGARSRASLVYERQEQDDADNPLSALGYEAEVISLLLTWTF